ncbi:MAG: hypothetical protein J5589_02085 [Firmicutes bacterium]|nr:hypothetical protein [Bacillota bacterium]
MQNFVQKVVEGYIFFLFFGGLWLFSLIRGGFKSRIKTKGAMTGMLLSVLIWVDYYLIYTGRWPIILAYIVPAAVLVILIVFHKSIFPYKTKCPVCGKRLSITEFLANDGNLCNDCQKKLRPELNKATMEEKIRQENARKKKGWIGWKPEKEYVIVFAADKLENVLLIDRVNMPKKPGKLSGVIGIVGDRDRMQQIASRTLETDTGIVCEEPEYMGRLNFSGPKMNIRFHVFVARKYSGTIKDDPEKQPVWIALKKMKYNQMSMDYPLWLARVVRGQKIEYYGRINDEGKVYEDVLELDVDLEKDELVNPEPLTESAE